MYTSIPISIVAKIAFTAILTAKSMLKRETTAIKSTENMPIPVRTLFNVTSLLSGLPLPASD